LLWIISSPLYVRTVQGTAFTLEERERMGLRGLLPPKASNMELQARGFALPGVQTLLCRHALPVSVLS